MPTMSIRRESISIRKIIHFFHTFFSRISPHRYKISLEAFKSLPYFLKRSKDSQKKDIAEPIELVRIVKKK